LGFRIGQSSGECDVAISLYPADWPFAIFKVLTDEHPPIPQYNKKTPATDGQIPVYLCGVPLAEFNQTAIVLAFCGIILGREHIAVLALVDNTLDKEP